MTEYLQVRDRPHARYQTMASDIHAGQVVVYRQFEPVQQLAKLAQQLLQDEFGDLHPVHAEQQTKAQTYQQQCTAVQDQFQHNPLIRAQWLKVFQALHFDLEHTYLDKVALRIIPSKASHHGQRLAATPVHRDSWGSNIPEQINWWLPIYPVTADNSLVLYPDYWNRPIQNTSAQWDYALYKSARKQSAPHAAPRATPITYPTAPYATVALDELEPFALVVEVGDLVGFSGAHLHGGQPNRSGVTRISAETRTVVSTDLRTPRASPNIDGAGKKSQPQWFRHAQTGRALRLS